MYHIKNDKRAYRSAELISKGLFKCLNEKDFINITVSDVQRASGVGRATFYRLFDNLSDVLVYQCDNVLNKLVLMNEGNLFDHRYQFINHIENWMKHDEVLIAIFKSKRFDILYSSYQRYAFDIKDKMYPEVELEETRYDYFSTVLTTFIFSVLAKWVMRGKKETPEELYNILSTLPTMFDKRI